ncbi:hypothetical protein F2P81_008899 [Scophthalmus maximus]|uniref:Linker for activation of T-cells family member 2 n=1 Tax=Scophthalmus maximus TaxID=52904 RepID=A0A6A4T050_SCOMX|nr:hypothetical protein F2P81_008899 [Scophthalmus maximus]
MEVARLKNKRSQINEYRPSTGRRCGDRINPQCNALLRTGPVLSSVIPENRTETEDVCFGEVLRVGECGEVLKEEAQLVLLLVKNEGSWTTEGMSGNSSLLAAVLTVVSVVSLSLLSLLCLRCKRKSKVIHEELQAYDLPTFEIPEESSAAYESSDYENVKQDAAQPPDVYANFIKSLQIKDDEDDYENSEFLEQTAQQSQDEEPDYVNEDERLIRTIRKHQ